MKETPVPDESLRELKDNSAKDANAKVDNEEDDPNSPLTETQLSQLQRHLIG